MDRPTRIAIVVAGGNIQAVLADHPLIEAVVVDWDNIDAGQDAPPDLADMVIPGTDRIDPAAFPYAIKF